MNTIGYRIFFGMILAGLLTIPSVSRADTTIGISPASIDVQVFTHGTRQERINISRSTTEGETVFRVEKMGMDLVTIPENTTVTIPNGATSQDYFFTIDATDTAVGEYDGIFSFTLIPSEDQLSEINGTAVEFVLKTSVYVSVIDQPDASVALSLYDFPFLLSNVGVSDVRVAQSRGTEGRVITTTWNITNAGTNPLDGAVSSVRITRKDDIFFDDQHVAAATIPAQGMFAQSSSFVLPESYPSGRYVAHVSAGGHEATAVFWVIKPVLWWCLGGFLLSLLVAGIAILQTIRRKR